MSPISFHVLFLFIRDEAEFWNGIRKFFKFFVKFLSLLNGMRIELFFQNMMWNTEY
jgi:hypothetical protein